MQSLIIISGPTASGKTALGIELAQRIGGEIVSGDSMQIYRGMDIGTAKPTIAERAAAVHHMIDIADIQTPFSVSEFIRLASECIDDISSRKKVPILVGGTGMYIRMLTSGRFFEADGANAELREELYAFAAQNGAEALHARLEELDPRSASEIHPNNIKRVIRAIELASSGTTKSELADSVSECASPYCTLHLHLTCADRAAIYQNCDTRVDRMLDEGLLSEVQTLCERGLRQTPTASQAIGYKEFYSYFDGLMTLDDATALVKQHTRNYVKRQMTYFTKFDDRVIFDISSTDRSEVLARALAISKEFLADD